MRRKARERSGLFVAEGIRTVEELLASSLVVVGAVASEVLDRTPRGKALAAALDARGVDVLRVDERDFHSASDTENPQGVLAIAEQPVYKLAAAVDAGAEAVRLLVLDGIQDPGNVGALLRTAAALGVTATVALPGTVDVWNAKVVRSAVGMQFHHPTPSSTKDELLPFLRERGIVLWGADARGELVDTVTPPRRLALALGNEGAGLGDALRGSCERLVALPMAPGAESLNVAVAAGIMLFEFRPRPAVAAPAP